MRDGLSITKETEADVCTLHLSGRIDTITSPGFDAEIKEVTGSISRLILDFSDVAYISSAGLRVLLAAQKAMMKKDGMELRHVSEAVSEVFEVTGFDSILTIV